MRSLTLNLLIVAIFSYCCLVPRVGFAGVKVGLEPNKILISGKIDNQSSHPWQYIRLSSFKLGNNHYSDPDIQNNIDFYHAPAKGNFIANLPIGPKQSIKIYLYAYAPPSASPIICTFKIKETSDTTATMKLVSKDDYAAPIECSFSGDVNDNTATITVINNPNWAPSK